MRDQPRSLGEREPALPHESGHKHVTGEAIYVDDQAQPQEMLEVWPVCSPHAHAKILRRDATAARLMPGITTILLAEDVPGLNDTGAVRHDEILLADKEVFITAKSLRWSSAKRRKLVAPPRTKWSSNTKRCRRFSQSRSDRGE